MNCVTALAYGVIAEDRDQIVEADGHRNPWEVICVQNTASRGAKRNWPNVGQEEGFPRSA